MLKVIHDLTKLGSQFVIATHSPIIMAYPYARIYQLNTSEVSEVSYEETEHYKITQDFLNHRKGMLDVLLQDD